MDKIFASVKGISKGVRNLCKRAFNSGYDFGFSVGKEAQLEDITEHINNFLCDDEYGIPTDVLELLKKVYNMGSSDGRNAAVNTIEYYTEARGIAKEARPASSVLLKAWKSTYDTGYNDGYEEGFNNGNAHPTDTINDMVASEKRDMILLLHKLNDGEIGHNDVDCYLYDVFADIHDKAYSEGLENGAEDTNTLTKSEVLNEVAIAIGMRYQDNLTVESMRNAVKVMLDTQYNNGTFEGIQVMLTDIKRFVNGFDCKNRDNNFIK